MYIVTPPTQRTRFLIDEMKVRVKFLVFIRMDGVVFTSIWYHILLYCTYTCYNLAIKMFSWQGDGDSTERSEGISVIDGYRLGVSNHKIKNVEEFLTKILAKNWEIVSVHLVDKG